ncbi:hypothetical protein Y032_0421g1170 [Ancylostoma ceylanicum]|uniref:GIY-YIG domain-containing protein n=1 Tax=Ancylostoma ceylanicum TaxID=53326 RepID=A0A016X144_9BILA|nr:hypothetical protein Y032_0421g1170 [Ancylostoma ceylanicum]
MCGFAVNDIEILLEATLACNVFRFNNNFYAQRRGLAMGIRIAPLLAIVYLDHIEKASLTNGIILYKRYIDDVFAIGSSSSELAATLANLNAKDENIEFTVEEPDRDGFLPFLNVNVRICDDTTEIRWYKKRSSKNIILHSRSAHPAYMKANVVRNLIGTSERIAARTSETVDTIKRILFENGYISGNMATWRPYSAPDGITLVLPYLNERLAQQVNAIVKRSQLPVRLVFKPPPTLKEILTSSRVYENRCDEEECRYCTDKKICHLRGTVYLIKCNGCGQRYVGESGRPLRKRLDEHRRAFNRPQAYPRNSFSRHRTTVHTRDSPPEFEVTVLHRHLDNPVDRKIMEAREIKRYQPEINNLILHNFAVHSLLLLSPHTRMFLAAETDFGLKMLQHAPANESVVVSPLSVIFAMSMIQAGAKGTTKSQINDVISKGASDEDTADHYSKLSQQVLTATDGVQTRIANAFFLNKGYEVEKDYEEAITKKFSAKVESHDFDNADETAKCLCGCVTKGALLGCDWSTPVRVAAATFTDTSSDGELDRQDFLVRVGQSTIEANKP